MPTAKEQGRGEASDGEHAKVFCHEKRCVFETGIFGHVAGYNFRFAFRHIERSAIRFHEAGYKKQNERRRAPWREDKPARHKPNVYPACAATILSGVSEPTTITTGSTVMISGSS